MAPAAVSREQQRNLRKEIGVTAAAAMAECKDEVLKVRAAGLQLLDAVRGCDERTKATAQRVDAALKLGFTNEEYCQERWDKTGEAQKRFADGIHALDVFVARGFLGRRKWLVLGR